MAVKIRNTTRRQTKNISVQDIKERGIYIHVPKIIGKFGFAEGGLGTYTRSK